MTSITGTLSTTTAGITVTQASSSYPICRRVLGAEQHSYVLQIAPAFIRGTHIDLALGFRQQGTTTRYSQSWNAEHDRTQSRISADRTRHPAGRVVGRAWGGQLHRSLDDE